MRVCVCVTRDFYLHRHIACSSYDNGLGHWHHCLILKVLQILQLLILIDGIEIGEGHALAVITPLSRLRFFLNIVGGLQQLKLAANVKEYDVLMLAERERSQHIFNLICSRVADCI